MRVGPHPDRPRVVVGEGDPGLAAKAGVSLHLQTKYFKIKFNGKTELDSFYFIVLIYTTLYSKYTEIDDILYNNNNVIE